MIDTPTDARIVPVLTPAPEQNDLPRQATPLEEMIANNQLLVDAIATAGIPVNYRQTYNLADCKTGVDIVALGKLLVAKGVITADELEMAQMQALHDVLAEVYQKLEEAKLQAEQEARKPVVAHQPLVLPNPRGTRRH